VPAERAVTGHLRDGARSVPHPEGAFLLTVSGIVVGVASLVVMASLLEIGGRTLARASGQATGDDVITVSDDWDAINNNPDAKRIGRDDRDALAGSTLLPGGTTVTATYGMVKHEGDARREAVRGVRDRRRAGGVRRLRARARARPAFVASEYEGARRVAIVGSNVRDGAVSPGDTIRVEGESRSPSSA
jgi:hypothetical protein